MPRRRWVLRGLGTIGIAGFAGCSSESDDPDEDENEEEEADENDDGDESETEAGSTRTSTTTDPGAEAGGPLARTLEHGVLMPLTGDLGNLGSAIRDGAVLPFGLLDGETPFTLDFQVEDTQTSPSYGRTAARTLVDAGYPAVTGAASSEVTLQVARNVFVPNGVLACSPSSTSPAIRDLDDENLVWRTPPTDRLQGQLLARVASEREDAATAATLHVDNSYGQLLSESFTSAFRDRGGTVRNQVPFPQGARSYSSQLSQALRGDPDVLVVIGYPESGAQLFRDYYAEYADGRPILVTGGLRDPTLPQNVGNALSEIRGTAPLAAGPGTEFFEREYRREYGSAPGVFTSQAFDATAVCLLANAAAGRNAGPAIAEQMRRVANPGGRVVTPASLADGLVAAARGTDIQYRGASSAIEFDRRGDLRAATYELFGFRPGGGVETIEEIEFST